MRKPPELARMWMYQEISGRKSLGVKIAFRAALPRSFLAAFFSLASDTARSLLDFESPLEFGSLKPAREAMENQLAH